MEVSFGTLLEQKQVLSQSQIQSLEILAMDSMELGRMLLEMNEKEPIASVTLIGLCTDVCVISNALIIKAFLPEVPIKVEAACCAGISPRSHDNALSAMAMCQVEILNNQGET